MVFFFGGQTVDMVAEQPLSHIASMGRSFMKCHKGFASLRIGSDWRNQTCPILADCYDRQKLGNPTSILRLLAQPEISGHYGVIETVV